MIDFATRSLGLPETDSYQGIHRLYGHGLPAAVIIAAVAGAFGVRRFRVAASAFISVHLHILGDLLGSRGTTEEDICAKASAPRTLNRKGKEKLHRKGRKGRQEIRFIKPKVAKNTPGVG